MAYVLYLMPIIFTVGRAPKYLFHPRINPDGPVHCSFAMMDYGFSPIALVLAKDITQADQDFLALQSDVFRFPADLDGPVDRDVQAFFEGSMLPTDWLTPATTWRELLRQVAGMCQFNQTYHRIAYEMSGEHHSIWDTATLNTRLRQMTADEQTWFLAAVEAYGYDPALVNLNSLLRLLVRQAGDYFADQTFHIGGYAF